MKTTLNNRSVIDLDIDGINMRDYPDFCDAYIAGAAWEDTGESLTEEELEELNDDSDLVYELVLERIY